MQFSVGLLFRIWSLVALTAGWLVLISNAGPPTTFLVLMCLGIAYSWVVGLRSLGGLWPRVWASVAFILGTLVIALHSALLAAFTQHSSSSARIQSMLVMMTPLAMFALVFLMRSWTWAAHDQAIRRQRP